VPDGSRRVRETGLKVGIERGDHRLQQEEFLFRFEAKGVRDIAQHNLELFEDHFSMDK